MKEYEYTVEELELLFLESQQNSSESYGKLFKSCIGPIMRSLPFPYDFEKYFSKLELEHEIYIRSVLSISSVKSFNGYKAWLYKTARNLLTDVIRKHNMISSHETEWDDTVSDQINFHDHIAGNNETVRDDMIDLDDCMKLLSEREAYLIRSVDEQNYTFQEIAQKEDTSASNIYNIYKSYKKAKKRLRLILMRKRLLSVFVFIGNCFDIGGGQVSATAPWNLKIIITAIQTIVLPLFWVTAVLTLFGKALTKKVEQTKQPAVQFWYVRQIIFVHFCTMLIPLIIVGGIQTLSVFMPSSVPRDIRAIYSVLCVLVVLGLTFFGYAVRAVIQYTRITTGSLCWDVSREAHDSLSRFLSFSAVLSSLSILFLTVFYVFDLRSYPVNSIRFLFLNNFWHAMQFFVVFMGYHILASVSILKIIEKVDNPEQMETLVPGKNSAEMYFTMGFIAMTVFTPLVNFLLAGFHLLPFVLFLAFSLWWVFIIEWNRRTTNRFMRVVLTFCLQFSLLCFLRFLQSTV